MQAKPKKKYCGVLMPAELVEWLNAEAERQSRTRSNLIIKLLEEIRNGRRK